MFKTHSRNGIQVILCQDKCSIEEKEGFHLGMLEVLGQGSASPAIEGYGVWGLNPTAGGIKSRRERTGGECGSAEEGPRFLGGLGEPQTSLR